MRVMSMHAVRKHHRKRSATFVSSKGSTRPSPPRLKERRAACSRQSPPTLTSSTRNPPLGHVADVEVRAFCISAGDAYLVQINLDFRLLRGVTRFQYGGRPCRFHKRERDVGRHRLGPLDRRRSCFFQRDRSPGKSGAECSPGSRACGERKGVPSSSLGGATGSEEAGFVIGGVEGQEGAAGAWLARGEAGASESAASGTKATTGRSRGHPDAG